MKDKNKKINVACGWSGGKDGYLACASAAKDGYGIEYLFNLVSKQGGTVSFHDFSKDIVGMQSRAIGIPLIQRKICSQSDSSRQFEVELEKLFFELKVKYHIEGIVAGYILPGDRQRELVRRLCSGLGIDIIEPLYKKNSKKILTDAVRSGLQALIVSVDTGILDSSWVGRFIDNEFIRYLESKRGVDFCGDRGEYHSLVIDGPLFNMPIEIKRSRKIIVGNHCFLNIPDDIA